jgi:GT2 family glycosyltransferase
MMPELSLILVSHNTRDDLERCLESLHTHPPALGHEIVVVDNASEDGSVELVRRSWPSVMLLESSENLGFARAANLGIRASHGALLLLLNSDTLVPAGAVEQLVERLRADPRVAIAGPRLVDAEGLPELSFGPMLTPRRELQRKLLTALYSRRWLGVVAWVDRRCRREHHPDWVSGACLLVRRDDAEAVGLLDERFFMYTEDVDFCASIRGRGRLVLFTPVAEVIHLRGRSARTAPEATELAYRRSQIDFYAKHNPGWLPLLRWYLRLRKRLPEAPRESAGAS